MLLVLSFYNQSQKTMFTKRRYESKGIGDNLGDEKMWEVEEMKKVLMFSSNNVESQKIVFIEQEMFEVTWSGRGN